MRTVIPSLVTAAALAGASVAQGPGIITNDTAAQPRNHKVINKTNLTKLAPNPGWTQCATGPCDIFLSAPTGGGYVSACGTAKLNAPPYSNGPGVWTMGLTLSEVKPEFGNTNSKKAAFPNADYVVIGTLDENDTNVASAFKPLTIGAKLNNPDGSNFGLNLCPYRGGSIVLAVVDHGSGPRFGMASPAVLGFHGTLAIPGLASYVDPDIGLINGEPWVVYVAGVNIVMGKLDISKVVVNNTTKTISGSVSFVPGSAVTIAVPSASGRNPHSPCFIKGSNGEVHGLHMAERAANDSDYYIAGDLHSGTQIQLVTEGNNPTAWLNNGGQAGGTIYYANSGSNTGFYSAIHSVEAGWMGGGQLSMGARSNGLASLLMAVKEQNSGPNVAIPILGLAGELPAPIAIPGFTGKLGLNPAGFLTLTPVVISNADERGEMSLAAFPQIKALAGINLPVQTLFIDPGATEKRTLSNMAHLNFVQ
ncbi:MAG: hypothetical protein CMJ85_08645 [Planctomycetes bacterium]|nr:hypothetical protein [Planctomycetota bacterium]